jgi:predicted molibdopterin-dependent oxidoreductase YjgC
MAVETTDIYEPYEKLVKLRVLEKGLEVPENNTLLRCYQFLDPDAVAMGNFCWNGDCHNCQVTLRRNGFARVCLSCQTVVKEGDSLESISPDVKTVLKGVLKK